MLSALEILVVCLKTGLTCYPGCRQRIVVKLVGKAGIFFTDDGMGDIKGIQHPYNLIPVRLVAIPDPYGEFFGRVSCENPLDVCLQTLQERALVCFRQNSVCKYCNSRIGPRIYPDHNFSKAIL